MVKKLTHQEKELLFRDLSARLPYNTQVYSQNENDWFDDEISTAIIDNLINEEYIPKPYLFPLSKLPDIAAEHEEEFDKIIDCQIQDIQNDEITLSTFVTEMHLYNKYHIDYNNLIPKELAIDATNLNIY